MHKLIMYRKRKQKILEPDKAIGLYVWHCITLFCQIEAILIRHSQQPVLGPFRTCSYV